MTLDSYKRIKLKKKYKDIKIYSLKPLLGFAGLALKGVCVTVVEVWPPPNVNGLEAIPKGREKMEAAPAGDGVIWVFLGNPKLNPDAPGYW